MYTVSLPLQLTVRYQCYLDATGNEPNKDTYLYIIWIRDQWRKYEAYTKTPPYYLAGLDSEQDRFDEWLFILHQGKDPHSG